MDQVLSAAHVLYLLAPGAKPTGRLWIPKTTYVLLRDHIIPTDISH